MALVSFSAFGSCDCQALQYNSPFFRKKVETIEDCKSELLQKLHENYLEERQCLLEEEVAIRWSCDGVSFEDKTFSCDLFKDLKSFEKGFASVLALTEPIVPEVECEDEPQAPTTVGPKIGLNFHNSHELKQKLTELQKNGAEIPVQEIFDRLNKESVTLTFSNDNLVGTMGKKGTSNDLGNTHAMNLKITKNIGDGTYLMVLDYETSLYTQYTDPANPDYKRLSGVTYVSQHFIEENISKLIIEKAKKGDAFYWKAGLGVQELNKRDSKGDLLFSAAAQQLAFHDVFIKLQKGSDADKRVITKRYTDVPQDGSESAYFAEGALGKRLTFFEKKSKNFRAFVDATLEARISGVKGASYIARDTSLNANGNLSKNLGLRVTAGKSVKHYTRSPKSSEKYVQVSVGGRRFQQGVRLVQPEQDRLLGYRNPVPQNVSNRDGLAPKRNKTFEFFFKVLW